MITVPKHIAIIMDGNGRWAEQQGLSRIEGHIKGLDSVENTIKYCLDKKISVVSLFAFSSENWLRPDTEVENLMSLFTKSLNEHVNGLNEKEIKLNFIGDRSKLDKNLCSLMHDAESLTRNNNLLTVNIGIDYGGRWDIINACKNIYNQINDGFITVDEINIEVFSSYLSTTSLPEPDLLIRTGGEKRISNFFLWQLAYTELYFSDIYWPDFGKDALEKAIESFNSRNRRFGAI